MKKLLLFLPLFLFAAASLPAQTTGEETSGTTRGWKGFLSVNYKGNKFVTPYNRLVSVSRHEYFVDGGGLVDEVTVDTAGQVVARFYYLDSGLEDTGLKSTQILNDRLKDAQNVIKEKTGVETRKAIKHYPDTTHAKMIEISVSSKTHLGIIFDHITEEWIQKGGRGDGRTLTFQ